MRAKDRARHDEQLTLIHYHEQQIQAKKDQFKAEMEERAKMRAEEREEAHLIRSKKMVAECEAREHELRLLEHKHVLSLDASSTGSQLDDWSAFTFGSHTLPELSNTSRPSYQ
ncbi:hypothetical protein M422DRAFT_254916 [Sphaerobolus stellatus SS14]|uniref:Meiosis-specific nuclear structural protein 1 n=1 Tax=Sphaerobolus stellatus (strain SS14) TaxID=990650 RepID=A0A0C9UG00_SPHS4|nr:hypothetical protein M422DRAFT_254916 [Sphaerobolus stellatus SS14]